MSTIYVKYPQMTSVPSSSFPLLAPNGTVGAPSYSFSTEASTGMWLNGAGSLDFSVAGVDYLRLSSNTVLPQKPINMIGSTDAIQILVKGNATQTNYVFQVQNSSTTNLFSIDNAGNFITPGAGTVQGKFIGGGTATNDSAAAGIIGEYITASVLRASAVSLTTDTAATVTSISLTAGDWDLTGCAGFLGNGGVTSVTAFQYGYSQTTNSLPGNAAVPDAGGQISVRYAVPASVPAASDFDFPLPTVRCSLSGTTILYLVVIGTFSASTLKGYGFIGARRAR